MIAYLILAAAVMFVSVASVLIRMSAAPAAVLAVYRLGLSFLVLTPVVAAGNRWPRPGARDLALASLAGTALALHFLFWITSLSYTSVASSVLLVSLHPLLVLPVAHFGGERVGRSQVMGVGLALLGMIIITGGFQAPSARGDFLALAGGMMMGLYLLAGREVRKRTATLPYIWMVYGIASVLVLAWALAAGLPLHPYDSREYLLFAGLALIPTLGGHGLCNWALSHVGAARVSAMTLGEPVGAAVLAWLILAEVPSQPEFIGGAAVLAGLILTFNRERKAGGRTTWWSSHTSEGRGRGLDC